MGTSDVLGVLNVFLKNTLMIIKVWKTILDLLKQIKELTRDNKKERTALLECRAARTWSKLLVCQGMWRVGRPPILKRTVLCNRWSSFLTAKAYLWTARIVKKNKSKRPPTHSVCEQETMKGAAQTGEKAEGLRCVDEKQLTKTNANAAIRARFLRKKLNKIQSMWTANCKLCQKPK